MAEKPTHINREAVPQPPSDFGWSQITDPGPREPTEVGMLLHVVPWVIALGLGIPFSIWLFDRFPEFRPLWGYNWVWVVAAFWLVSSGIGHAVVRFRGLATSRPVRKPRRGPEV